MSEPVPFWWDWQNPDFVDVVGHRKPERPFSIQGIDLTTMVFDYGDSAEIQKNLPPELVLDPTADTPAGKHPVVYAFGYHRDVRPAAFKLFGFDYFETLVGIND